MDKFKQIKYDEAKFKYDEAVREVSTFQKQMDDLKEETGFTFNEDEYIDVVEKIVLNQTQIMKYSDFFILSKKVNYFITYINLEILYEEKYSEGVFAYIDMESASGNDSMERTLILRKDFKEKRENILARLNSKLDLLIEFQNMYASDENKKSK